MRGRYKTKITICCIYMAIMRVSTFHVPCTLLTLDGTGCTVLCVRAIVDILDIREYQKKTHCQDRLNIVARLRHRIVE